MATMLSASRYLCNRPADWFEYQNPDMGQGDDLATLGGRLRAARREKKLGQIALARLAGVSQSVISDLERNEIHETAKILQIARAVGVHARWLQERVGPRRLTDQEPELHSDLPAIPISSAKHLQRRKWPFSAGLYRRFIDLDDEQQQHIAEIVEHQIGVFERKNTPPRKSGAAEPARVYNLTDYRGALIRGDSETGAARP